MSNNSRNLATGIIIGAAAGFLAGILISIGKSKKTGDVKSKIANITADAQERIKALRAMAQNPETKAKNGVEAAADK